MQLSLYNTGKQSAKIGFRAAAIGGIPGVLLYGGYILMMQPPPGGTGYQHPNVFLNDNTYVAPPVTPGF